MKQNLVRITVVTVCYNAEKKIERTMRSVLNQTYNNIEYLIIDGASKDKTLALVKKTASDYPQSNIVIVSEPDKGLYDAMNKGASLATGEYINYMNAGDYFFSNDVVEKVAEEMDNSDDLILGSSFTELRGKRQFKSVNYMSNGFPYGICHQSLFTRTSVMKENPFDLKYRIAADFDFEYKMSQKNRFHFVDIPISVTEVDEGVSVNNRVGVYREMSEIMGLPVKNHLLINAYIRDTLYSIPFIDRLRNFFLYSKINMFFRKKQ